MCYLHAFQSFEELLLWGVLVQDAWWGILEHCFPLCLPALPFRISRHQIDSEHQSWKSTECDDLLRHLLKVVCEIGWQPLISRCSLVSSTQFGRITSMMAQRSPNFRMPSVVSIVSTQPHLHSYVWPAAARVLKSRPAPATGQVNKSFATLGVLLGFCLARTKSLVFFPLFGFQVASEPECVWHILSSSIPRSCFEPEKHI